MLKLRYKSRPKIFPLHRFRSYINFYKTKTQWNKKWRWVWRWVRRRIRRQKRFKKKITINQTKTKTMYIFYSKLSIYFWDFRLNHRKIKCYRISIRKKK